MEVAIVVVGLLFLFIVIGGILGWVAFFRTDKILQDNIRVNRELTSLKKKLEQYKAEAKVDVNDTNDAVFPSDNEGREDNASTSALSSPSPWLDSSPLPKTANKTAEPNSNDKITPTDKVAQGELAQPHPLIENIKANWMVWIGGISIGFAGIFMVKYSMDNGLLGPSARIILSFITGILLHVAAYYLHVKKGQNDIFAALAGGASLILFAACLASLHLYQMVSPGLAFVVLAGISLCTMLLALVQGPVLAALGILGAYSVPVFVNTGSNNLTAALIYSFIVSVAALVLIRFVKREWLWIGTLVGAGFWWLASLSVASADISRLLYVLALAYVVIALETWDWRLINPFASHVNDIDVNEKLSPIKRFKAILFGDHKKILITLFIFILSWLVSIVNAPLVFSLVWVLPLFALFTLWVAYHHKILLPFAWIGLVATTAGLLMHGFDLNSPESVVSLSEKGTKLLLSLILFLSFVYSLFSLFAYKTSLQKGHWASLGLLAPLILIALGYIRVDSIQIGWPWALAATLLGAVYFNLLYRKKNELSPQVMVAIIFAGHVAYSLAVVILFSAATLTLALAFQVVTLAYLDRRFRLSILPILIKVLLVIVIARLTFNPWLLSYPADVHWSLWTYGGSFICCVVAAFLIKDRKSLAAWLKGVSAHLLMLTIFAETRYQLYDGDIFTNQYNFLEAAINTAVWGLMACVYKFRMHFAEHFVTIYRWISTILLLLASVNYVLFLLLLNNPLFTLETISSNPIFNILLLAYGLPCIIAFFIFVMQQEGGIKKLYGLASAMMTLIFFSIEIRHLWHGELNIAQPFLDGEIYTYSMVWLILAIVGSVLGIKYKSRDVYRASMLFLLLVVAKIFLIDTSGLNSLWRVAAFMGLGMALLALAYVHQKMGLASFKGDDSKSAAS